MISLIVFILILGLLVLIHEFGHFIAAKKNGVKVEEFGFGFPPRLFGFKRGETLYSINALPIGGFVKVYGEEYNELKNKTNQEKNRTFVYKKPWQKTTIIIAGVIMNLLLGVFIYYGLLMNSSFKAEPLLLLDNYHFRFGSQEERVLIGQTSKNSPAEKAGLKSGDQIISVSTDKPYKVNSASQLIQLVDKSDKKPVGLTVQNVRSGKTHTVIVTPYFNETLKRNIIGISLAQVAILHYDKPSEKLLSGFMHAYNVSAYNLNVFKTLLTSSFKEKSVTPVSQAVSGPIGIFGEIDDIVKSSGSKLVVNILNVTALLSLSLGVMNILPFPALDGGRLIFVLYEWITKKRANAKVEQYGNLFGIITLLSLAVLVSLNDIMRIIAH